MVHKVKPRIYVVTSKCGKYAWVTTSPRFELRPLGKNAKVFCNMIRSVATLNIFQQLQWEMRWHKVHNGSKAAYKRFMTAQLSRQGYIVIP